jgi:enoyl-CoA hydratase/carnithine racemase
MHPMSDYQHLIYEQRGPVTIITINRPERMNAIGPQTHRETSHQTKLTHRGRGR